MRHGLVSLGVSLAMLTGGGVMGCSSEEGPHFLFEPKANLADPLQFYDQPFPLETRLAADGTRQLTAFPRPPDNANLEGLVAVAAQAKGAPVIPVAYFRSTVPLAARNPNNVIDGTPAAPVMLLDVDPASPDHGRLFPTVAMTLEVDPYTPTNLLAVAARPGFVLLPHTKYAFLVRRDVGTLDGKKLASSKVIATLRKGGDPGGGLKAAFESVWSTADVRGIDLEEIAIATVFTTNDVVADLAALGEQARTDHKATISDLHVDPDDGAAHPRFCELVGTVTLPQFQKGKPPFDTEGLFVFDATGKLVKQSDLAVPITITLPKQAMPPTGFPLDAYMHGSGGLSSAAVDRGTWRPVTDASVCPGGKTDEWEGVVGCNIKGEGPAHVIAAEGFATYAAALPVNPERLPGAGETAYLNFVNLAAGRDLFRQGVIEQRLILDALLDLAIDPATVAACTGLSLPAEKTAYRFDAGQVFGQGQSMGGQYINMLGATEPRIRATAPTGAGGYWSYFILETSLVPGGAVGPILLGTMAKLTFLHPALHLFQQAWEPVDPMVYMPRVAARPLPNHPVRSIYEPVGLGDSYFPTTVYDAMVLAYGNEQAGTEVWPTMQAALELDGRKGIVPYPVSNNRESGTTPYTGVVVQYMGDGVYDPHAIYSQLDQVKQQLACFFSTMRRTNTAVVIAPGAPCP